MRWFIEQFNFYLQNKKIVLGAKLGHFQVGKVDRKFHWIEEYPDVKQKVGFVKHLPLWDQEVTVLYQLQH